MWSVNIVWKGERKFWVSSTTHILVVYCLKVVQMSYKSFCVMSKKNNFDTQQAMYLNSNKTPCMNIGLATRAFNIRYTKLQVFMRNLYARDSFHAWKTRSKLSRNIWTRVMSCNIILRETHKMVCKFSGSQSKTIDRILVPYFSYVCERNICLYVIRCYIQLSAQPNEIWNKMLNLSGNILNE